MGALKVKNVRLFLRLRLRRRGEERETGD